jgi:hypothetical protein
MVPGTLAVSQRRRCGCLSLTSAFACAAWGTRKYPSPAIYFPALPGPLSSNALEARKGLKARVLRVSRSGWASCALVLERGICDRDVSCHFNKKIVHLFIVYFRARYLGKVLVVAVELDDGWS